MDIVEALVEIPLLGGVVDKELAVAWYPVWLDGAEVCADDFDLGMEVGKLDCPILFSVLVVAFFSRSGVISRDVCNSLPVPVPTSSACVRCDWSSGAR